MFGGVARGDIRHIVFGRERGAGLPAASFAWHRPAPGNDPGTTVDSHPILLEKTGIHSPFAQTGSLQKVAAEILLQALGRPKHSKAALQEFLKQYDAVTAVRLTLRS